MSKLIDEALFQTLHRTATESSRKRSHLNLHAELSDPVQRLCIGLEPGTYVRPHRHPESYKWEMMLILSGRVVLLLFDDEGKVSRRIELSDQGPTKAVELSPDTWHTVFPLGGKAVIMEVKPGPFTPTAAENFAAWAPEEGSEGVESFLAWAEGASAGEGFA